MSENRFEGLIEIGLRIRESRKQRGLSLQEVAQRAGVTKGLLSKFENFRAIPSLPVLAKISSALDVDMAQLVRGIGFEQEKPYTLVKSEDKTAIERDNAIGFFYESIVSKQLGEYAFSSMVLTIEPGSKRKAVTTEGFQFTYILSGEIEFLIGPDALSMQAGDSLFFNGRIRHVPVNKGEKNAQILAIYLIDNKLI